MFSPWIGVIGNQEGFTCAIESISLGSNPIGFESSLELSATAKDCWETVETSNAELVIDIDSTISADRSRLRQVIENLVRNAVEHGGDAVTVTIGELDDGFFVDDNGPGIPEGTREKIFEATYTTHDDGTGFGLSIVEEIIEAHGWQIQVTEGSDGGARFEITGMG